MLPFLLSLGLRQGIDDALVRWKFEVVPRQVFRAQHLGSVCELLVHVQGVYESLAQVVDGVLGIGQRIDLDFVFFVIEVDWDWGSRDVSWSPPTQI